MQKFLRCLLFIFCTVISATNLVAQLTPPGREKLQLIPSSYSGLNFRNDIQETPEMFLYVYEYLYIGAGVSIGDINNDGLQDIYFSSTLGSNKLYLNEGNFHFRDITASAGVDGGAGINTGVNMVDINNDGYLDIFLCKSGYKDPSLRKKVLYINNKNGTFTDQAAEYGLADASYSIQSYFFDFDNDGDKDLYLLNHPIDFSRSMTIPASMENGKMVYVNDTTNTRYVSDRLFENKGNKFVDVTAKAGLINHAFGLSVSVSDINNDGWQDLYVANDFNKPDCIYINDKKGGFNNKLADYVKHVSFSAMGSDISDINNDGLEDIFVMDMAVQDPVRQKQLFAVNQNYDKFQLLLQFGLFYQYPRNTMQLNNGDNTYSEVGNFAGVAETEWSWSPVVADFDNDGYKDLYITNGLKRDMTDWDYKVFVLDSIMNAMNTGKSVDLNSWLQSMPSVPVQNYFYHNNSSLQFDDVSTSWTNAPASFSSGAAYADLDNDGDLDMVVNNVDGEAFLLQNNSRQQGSGNHFANFKFYDKPGSFNEPYGTTVKLIFADGSQQLQHFDPQRGFLSTSEHAVHFGTGIMSKIPTVEISFPNGKKLLLNNIPADSTYTFYMSDAVDGNVPEASAAGVRFADVTQQNSFNFTQVENDFIDFKREPLIPYKCSRKGPYYSRGDVNNDQLEDFYLAGAAGEPGTLMMQTAAGNFVARSIPAFVTDKKYEDMGSVLFDADADGDLDLYVVSGGAQFDAGSNNYQDRLYLNDGKGNFTRSTDKIPTISSNGSVVTALDFDADGDLDLFVGGHVLPGSFPKADKSMLLQNTSGVFTDVTDIYAPAFSKPGIVNQAIWNTEGGKKELILAGEWMSPTIFSFAGDKFVQQKSKVTITNLNVKDSTIKMDDLTGWWYNMKMADVDGDGDMDFIMGNRGLNSSIKASVNKPCTVYAKDFDKNGSYDAVLGYYNGDKCYPLYSRDQLMDQMPGMRKKFVRYRDYSGKTMDEIFTADEKQGMDIYTTRFFESGILFNEGNNNYRFSALPYQAQLSTVNDFIYEDIDKDGIRDLILGGNSYDPAVMVGVYDARAALQLKGAAGGKFIPISPGDNALKIDGEVRKLIWLPSEKTNRIVFLRNNDAAKVMEIR